MSRRVVGWWLGFRHSLLFGFALAFGGIAGGVAAVRFGAGLGVSAGVAGSCVLVGLVAFLTRVKGEAKPAHCHSSARSRKGRAAWAAREVVGHRLFTRDAVMCWYRLPGVPWASRSQGSAEDFIRRAAMSTAHLVGREVHVRVTQKRYDAARWARRTYEAAYRPHPMLGELLIETQGRINQRRFLEKECYIGVKVAGRSAVRAWLGRVFPSVGTWEARTLDQAVRKVDRLVAGEGIRARPVGTAQMQLLLHRSAALGLPAPGELPGIAVDGVVAPDDMVHFDDVSEWVAPAAFARSTRIEGEVSGTVRRRFVVVSTPVRMVLRDIPQESGPWLQRLDEYSEPVEVSLRFVVIEPNKVLAKIRGLLLRINNQLKHYRQFDVDPPVSLEVQAERVNQVRDEVERDGDKGQVGARCEVWVYFAVAGETEQQALERSEEVSALFAPELVLVRPSDQYEMARSFFPGEKLPHRGYMRPMPVLTLAGAVVQATARIGDRVGIPMGETAGTSCVPAFWDPHASMRGGRDRSGGTVLGGIQGSGKTTLAGSVIFWSCMFGGRWTVVDPVGRLNDLVYAPEFEGRARSVDALHGEPGDASPYGAVREPRREAYDSEKEWKAAMEQAQKLRQSMGKDLLQTLLPSSLAYLAETELALDAAISHCDAGVRGSLDNVVEFLALSQGENRRFKRELAGFLRSVASTTVGRLTFPRRQERDGDDDLLLEVISLKNLILPDPDTDPKAYKPAEREAVALFYATVARALGEMYDLPRNIPKGMFVDEYGLLASFPGAQVLFNTAFRNTRKHLLRLILGSQNMTDSFKAGVSNVLDSCIVGRIEDSEEQRESMKALRLPVGQGHEYTLGTLRAGGSDAEDEDEDEQEGVEVAEVEYREFLWSDGRQYKGVTLVEPLRVTVGDLVPAHIVDLLDSRPGSLRHDSIVSRLKRGERVSAA